MRFLAVQDHRGLHRGAFVQPFGAGFGGFCCGRGGCKQFKMNAFLGDTQLHQGIGHAVDHGLWAAQVKRLGRRQRGKTLGKKRHPVLVNASLQGIGPLVFAAEHMVNFQPTEVAVFQVFQLLLEQNGRRGAVAVVQRKRAAGFGLQHGGQDAEHGGNSAACSKSDVVRGALGHGVKHKISLRGHGFQGRSGGQLGVGPGAELSVFHLLDGHAELAAHGAGTQGIRPANFLAVQSHTKRQVLPCAKTPLVPLVGRHVQGHGNRVRCFPAHFPHRESVKFGGTPSLLGFRGGDQSGQTFGLFLKKSQHKLSGA